MSSGQGPVQHLRLGHNQSVKAARIESAGQKRKREYLQGHARALKTPEPAEKARYYTPEYAADYPGGDHRREAFGPTPWALRNADIWELLQPVVEYPIPKKPKSGLDKAYFDFWTKPH